MAGRGSVENRGKGSWRLTVSVGIGKDGKYIKKRKTVQAKNKTVAGTLLNRFIEEIDNGSYITPAHIKFKDYVEVWKIKPVKLLSPSTIEMYTYLLDGRIIPAIGHLKMEDITDGHITDFLQTLDDDGLSSSTIHKHYNALSGIFKHAIKKEIINKNPLDKVDRPSVTYKESQVYNATEEKQLLKLLENEKNKQQTLIVKVALKTGMRKGEILALQWEDVDFSTNTIHVRHSLSYTKANGYQLKEPKTKGSNRDLGVPIKLMNELKKHIYKKKTDRMEADELWRGGEYYFVFSSDLGKPLLPSVPTQWLDRFLKRNGFKKITFHSLRHTFATGLVNRGGNINKISKFLGHSSISMTVDTYSHLLEEDREIADMVDEDYV